MGQRESIFTLKKITWGVVAFIAGSLCFSLASFFNAISLAIEGRVTGMRAFDLAAAALCCSQLGSVCFVGGSLLYQPGLDTDCGARDDDGGCINNIQQGTYLYLAGSVFYVLQSLLKVALVFAKTSQAVGGDATPAPGDG